MLWTCDMLRRPTLRNLTDSYEQWAYRNGFWKELQRLEKEQFLERHGLGPDQRLYRLTERGRLRALGGRDPERCWKRKWDGDWRVVVFDISSQENNRRNALHYYLRNHGFGCLQRSVWVTPDRIDQVQKDMGGASAKVKSMAFLSAQLCGGERNEQIVQAAWDFGRINELYSD
jgi:phenylacetic acid degradation operon negative regulatory protein